MTKWYKRDSRGHYRCLMCHYTGTSFLGVTSHIRKHRNERERMGKGQRTLDGKVIP